MINKRIDGSIVNLNEVGSVRGMTLYGEGEKMVTSPGDAELEDSMQTCDLAQEIAESDAVIVDSQTACGSGVQRVSAFGDE